MPPNRRAGRSAFVEKYTKLDGESGFTVHCQLCRPAGLAWSSRTAARNLIGSRRQARAFDSWTDVMDLYTVHMRLRHPDEPQPDWELSEDVDQEVFDAENRFFEPRPVSREERLLREIFGEKGKTQLEQERELRRIKTTAARLGHQVHLPAEKVPGVSKASQGWVCTCGASDPDTHCSSASAVKDAARQHLRDAIEASTS